ncbi:MAG TPA: hypothetical protein VFH89_13550 [Sphingomicrobium sp.]|nr:hypothetical protein [Sphingomicrobium sp.]
MTDLLAPGTSGTRRGSGAAIALLLLAACSQQSQQNDVVANASESVTPVANAPSPEAPLNPPAPGEPGGLPDDRTPVVEGPIDPKSAQGAGQVLQTYFALIEQGKYADAYKLWSDGGKATGETAGQFAKSFEAYREFHANIGGPGDMEGAAGSSYVDYPVQLYGRTKDGKEFNARGTMTLRRVNDVPGSTAEQRSWHIYKSDVPAQK